MGVRVIPYMVVTLTENILFESWIKAVKYMKKEGWMPPALGDWYGYWTSSEGSIAVIMEQYEEDRGYLL